MKTTPKIFIGLILVLIVVGGIIYIWDKPAYMTVPETTTTATTTPTEIHNSVTYFCSEGQVDALFTNNSVALSLPDNRSLELPQVVSGSGIRYESTTNGDDIVLSGKGSDAMLVENGKTIFSNCLSGYTSASMTGGDKTLFEDDTHTFSFAYPSAFILSSGDIGYTQNWSVNATTSGLVLAVVTTPTSYQPQTNFSDAKLTVGVSSDPSAIAMCTTATNGEKSAGNVTINGVTYAKSTLGDAGAGNLYDSTTYRTIQNGECYSVGYTIHSTQLANYPASAHISAFDKIAVQNALEGIVQSFSFLPATR